MFGIINFRLLKGNMKVPFQIEYNKNIKRLWPNPASGLVKEFVITLNMLIIKLLSI